MDYIACHAPPSIVFPKQEYWSGLSFLSPGDLPNPGIKPMSPAWQADCLPLSHLESPKSHYKWFVVVNLLNDWNRHSTKNFQMTNKLVIAWYHYSPRKRKLKPQWDSWYTTIKWPKFRHLTTFGKDVEWEGTEYTHSKLTLRGSLEVFSSVWMIVWSRCLYRK